MKSSFFKNGRLKNDRFEKRWFLKSIVFIILVVSLTIVNDEPLLTIGNVVKNATTLNSMDVFNYFKNKVFQNKWFV